MGVRVCKAKLPYHLCTGHQNKLHVCSLVITTYVSLLEDGEEICRSECKVPVIEREGSVFTWHCMFIPCSYALHTVLLSFLHQCRVVREPIMNHGNITPANHRFQ